MKNLNSQNELEHPFTKECEVSCVAVSLAGHDKGKLFIIVSADKDSVWLSDGRIRTIANPKRKNRKHIQVCKENRIEQLPVTDETIRYALKHYMKNHCNNKEVKEYV